MNHKNKTQLGSIGENIAISHYQKLGYSLVAKNYFNRKGKQLGEIDFIAQKDRNLVFVEVKTRMKFVNRYGSGAESVTRFKQARLLRAVSYFLQSFSQFQDYQPQIDVCVVEIESIDNFNQNVIIISNAVESRNG